MSQRVPTRFQLRDGYSFTRLINGAWQLSAGHSPGVGSQEQVLADLEQLAKAGLTTFDCADIYTGVEELLGELRRRLRPQGIDIEIHTKFVPDRGSLATISRSYVEDIIHRSLTRLGVERLDLVQFAWWDWSVPGWIDTTLWLDELRQQGKIARIGVTNTDVAHLADILDAGVPVVTNQVQYSLLDRRPDNGMIGFCREQGVELLCYGTLAGGFLTDTWLGHGDPEEPLQNRSLVKYRLIIDEFGGWAAFQLLLHRLAEVAAKHRVSIANVASRWVLERPTVGAVIVGAASSRHLESNLRLFDFELDSEDLNAIGATLTDHQGPPGDIYSVERVWSGPHARIMWTGLNESD